MIQPQFNYYYYSTTTTKLQKSKNLCIHPYPCRSSTAITTNYDQYQLPEGDRNVKIELFCLRASFSHWVRCLMRTSFLFSYYFKIRGLAYSVLLSLFLPSWLPRSSAPFTHHATKTIILLTDLCRSWRHMYTTPLFPLSQSHNFPFVFHVHQQSPKHCLGNGHYRTQKQEHKFAVNENVNQWSMVLDL